jgi:hypothetical protein
LAIANQIVRRGAVKSGGSAKVKTVSSRKKNGKKVVKSVARKQAKRPAKMVTPSVVYTADHGLMTAFHHMQRAAVVMSLMEKGTGKDLQRLLKRGVKLYRKAMEDETDEKVVLRAIGVLRAVEHLSMAGLYAARRKHRQKVTAPTPDWLAKVIAEADHRLAEIAHQERGKGTDLLPVTMELLRQAEDGEIDAHLAFELAMAGDALCFALENGL